MGNLSFFYASVLYGIFGKLGGYAGSLDDFESSVGTRSNRILYDWVTVNCFGAVGTVPQ